MRSSTSGKSSFAGSDSHGIRQVLTHLIRSNFVVLATTETPHSSTTKSWSQHPFKYSLLEMPSSQRSWEWLCSGNSQTGATASHFLARVSRSSTKPSPAPNVSTQVMALNDTDGFEAFDDARENYRECAHVSGCSHASAIRCAGSDAGKRNSASKLSHDT
jgi:hypothetical protein